MALTIVRGRADRPWSTTIPRRHHGRRPSWSYSPRSSAWTPTPSAITCAMRFSAGYARRARRATSSTSRSRRGRTGVLPTMAMVPRHHRCSTSSAFSDTYGVDDHAAMRHHNGDVWGPFVDLVILLVERTRKHKPSNYHGIEAASPSSSSSRAVNPYQRRWFSPRSAISRTAFPHVPHLRSTSPESRIFERLLQVCSTTSSAFGLLDAPSVTGQGLEERVAISLDRADDSVLNG